MNLRNLLTLAIVFAPSVFAGTTGLPWDRPIERVMDSITGPVAYAIGGVGIVGAMGTLMFHGDLSEFGRRSAQVGLAGGGLCLAVPTLAALFGVSGAWSEQMKVKILGLWIGFTLAWVLGCIFGYGCKLG